MYCVDYAGEIKPRTVEAFEILEGEIGICDSSHMPCYLCTTKEMEKIGSCTSDILYAGVFYTPERAEAAVRKQLEVDEKQQSALKKVQIEIVTHPDRVGGIKGTADNGVMYGKVLNIDNKDFEADPMKYAAVLAEGVAEIIRMERERK